MTPTIWSRRAPTSTLWPTIGRSPKADRHSSSEIANTPAELAQD
jgi:hypothetical protein